MSGAVAATVLGEGTAMAVLQAGATTSGKSHLMMGLMTSITTNPTTKRMVSVMTSIRMEVSLMTSRIIRVAISFMMTNAVGVTNGIVEDPEMNITGRSTTMTVSAEGLQAEAAVMMGDRPEEREAAQAAEKRQRLWDMSL